jgi:hypothetical protein
MGPLNMLLDRSACKVAQHRGTKVRSSCANRVVRWKDSKVVSCTVHACTQMLC